MSNLIVLNGLTAIIQPSANEMKEQALASGALIGRVNSPEEQAEAVEAQKTIKTLLNLVESSRVEVKAPVLEAGRKIDTAATAFTAALDKELQRLMTLCGNYQTLLLKKQRAEEAAKRKELEDLERKKQEEIAQARNHEHVEAIEEKYHHKVQSAVFEPVKPRPQAAGQSVSEDWEIVVDDAPLLARAHPNCVSIVPKMLEIKSLLNAGVKVAGVKAEKKIKSSVRTGKQQPLIEA